MTEPTKEQQIARASSDLADALWEISKRHGLTKEQRIKVLATAIRAEVIYA